jgi:hypothetical protein
MGGCVYRVQDWSSYNTILKKRWDIGLWFPSQAVERWTTGKHYGGKNKELFYTDEAIRVCLTMRYLLNLSLRATQGFIQSLIDQLGLPISCPSYSQLSRRSAKLKVRGHQQKGVFYLLFDSTGLKVAGPGEWQTRLYRASQRKSWVKLHIAVDPVSLKIIKFAITGSRIGDSSVMRKMLSQIKHPLQKVWGDGAYDDRKVYKDLYQRKIYPVIPPSVNATESYSYRQRAFMGRRRPLIYRHPELEPRDEAIRFIQQFSNKHQGKQVWKLFAFTR